MVTVEVEFRREARNGFDYVTFPPNIFVCRDFIAKSNRSNEIRAKNNLLLLLH
jgi:hypothetical protein